MSAIKSLGETASPPLVSVLMCTYNDRLDFLELALGSILSQDYPALEVIIVDDSTNQATTELIDRIGTRDRRVRILRRPQRLGFNRALNLGLSEAAGALIARADADDVQHLDRISRQVSFMQEHPTVGIAGCWMSKIDELGRTIGTARYPSDIRCRKQMLVRNSLPHRRDVLAIPHRQDWALR